MAMIRSSIGLYLRYSVAATAAVVVVPLAIVVFVALSVRTGTPILTAILIGGGLSLAAAIVGSQLWKRRPESMDVCFGELMVWSFIRRRRAEQQLQEGAEVLGLDRGGRPLRRTQMTKQQRLKILHDLAVALETKDPYTHGHSTRVESLVSQMAATLKLSPEEIEELCTAASLHDVGKIRVPNRILRKPDRLTIDEQLIVQEHASVGAWMVAGVSNGNIVASVRHHHERWDGNGYPDGLSGRDIPLFARVIAVADAYDAMTSTRPYRPSMTRQQALQELEEQAGRQFDPEVVDAFMATLPRRVPLAGVIGLGLAGRLLRRTNAWAARAGSGSVASGVASVGAVSVLIASLFAPPVALTKPAPERAAEDQVAGGPVDNSAEVVDGDLVLSPEGPKGNADGPLDTLDVGLEARERSATRASAQEEWRGGYGTRVLGNVLSRVRYKGDSDGPSNGDGPHGDRHRPDAGSPDTTPPTDGDDRPGTDNPPPDRGGDRSPPDDDPQLPDDDPPPTKVKELRTDPQPERGRDCAGHPEQGRRKGNLRHCGG